MKNLMEIKRQKRIRLKAMVWTTLIYAILFGVVWIYSTEAASPQVLDGLLASK